MAGVAELTADAEEGDFDVEAGTEHHAGVGLMQKLPWAGCNALRSGAEGSQVIELQTGFHERLHDRCAKGVL